MQNDRHAVVNGRNQGIGRGSDNSVSIQLLPFIVLPDIVEAGEGKQLAALESNAIGLLPLACLLPLVEATRRHQAAPTLEWPANTGLVEIVSARALMVENVTRGS